MAIDYIIYHGVNDSHRTNSQFVKGIEGLHSALTAIIERERSWEVVKYDNPAEVLWDSKRELDLSNKIKKNAYRKSKGYPLLQIKSSIYSPSNK